MSTYTGYTAEVTVKGTVAITPRGPGRLLGRARTLDPAQIARVDIKQPRRLINGTVNIIDADWRGDSDRVLFTWQQREQFTALVKALSALNLKIVDL